MPVSLVIGGIRGLGLAVARALRARGDLVHVTYRGSTDLAAALEPEFPERIHHCDAEDAISLTDLMDHVLSRDRRLDHLIHAVGEFTTGPLATLAHDEFRRMFRNNTESAFLAAHAALPALRETRGSMLVFGCAGLSGLRARREAAAYAAAKSALLVLTRSLAAEEGPHGVRVNMISPGIIPHEHAAADTFAKSETARIPLGRVGTPDEVAAAAVWLCSPAAAYVTGANLEVSGGWML